MYFYKIEKNGKIIGTHCGPDPIPDNGWIEITQAEYEELQKETNYE